MATASKLWAHSAVDYDDDHDRAEKRRRLTIGEPNDANEEFDDHGWQNAWRRQIE